MEAMNIRMPTASPGVEPVTKPPTRARLPAAIAADPLDPARCRVLISVIVPALLMTHLKREGNFKIAKNLRNNRGNVKEPGL
jgi:hypothetical protein